MSLGEGGEAPIDFDTAKARDWPSVRQFNVFLANRIGALLDLVRRFEQLVAVDRKRVAANHERLRELVATHGGPDGEVRAFSAHDMVEFARLAIG